MMLCNLTPSSVFIGKYDNSEGLLHTIGTMKCGEWTVSILSYEKSISRSALQKPTCIYYVPLLKSALQKAIRLRKGKLAVKIAYQLLRQDLVEFLRRLPIYMLEDTYLQPKALIRCIWLMCACGKGWRLCENDIRFLLGIVQRLCELEYRELLDMKSPGEGLEKKLNELKGALSPLEGSVVCIWIRSEFGGLIGDMCFLRNLAIDWLDREKDGWDLEEEEIEVWKGEFPSGDRLYMYEGVDFHCYPGLLKELIELGWNMKITNEEFRRAMWYGQSWINLRDWLFENNKTKEAKEETDRFMKQHNPIIESMRPYLEIYAKKAWIAKVPEKSIDMYFTKKL